MQSHALLSPLTVIIVLHTPKKHALDSDDISSYSLDFCVFVIIM